jgi:hypothetical protein
MNRKLKLDGYDRTLACAVILCAFVTAAMRSYFQQIASSCSGLIAGRYDFAEWGLAV